MNNTQPLKAFKRGPSLEESKWYKGLLTTNLAEKDDTNGGFSIIEANLEPGKEAPPHTHTHEDELFYVLDGEFDAYVGDQAFNVRMGECVFLPRAIPHGFAIRSPRIRLLTLFVPGGLEQAFKTLTQPAEKLEIPEGMETYATADLTKTVEILSGYGIHILSPEEIAKQLPLYPRPVAPDPGK